MAKAAGDTKELKARGPMRWAGLMNRGFLSAKKIGRRNEYTALVSEAEYQTAQTKNFLDKIYEGSAKGLVSMPVSGDLLAGDEYGE